MNASQRSPVVAVFGSSTLQELDPAYEAVRRLGAELAARKFAVMTGGYGGAMAAASRGAHEAGGHVIGVTVDLFEHRGGANPWVRERCTRAICSSGFATSCTRPTPSSP